MDTILETKLKRQVDEFLLAHQYGERILSLMAFPSVLAGAGYLIIEHFTGNDINDFIFVVLLVVATIFLSMSVLIVRRILCRSAVLLFYKSKRTPTSSITKDKIGYVELRESWISGPTGPGDLLGTVFYRPGMVISAVAYGFLLSLAPLMLNIHSQNIGSQFALMVFLFLSNAVAGAALFSIIIILRHTWHLANQLEIDFFSRHSDSNFAYSRLLRHVALTAAIYIGTAQVSIVFSRFGGPWVYAYALFAVFLYVGIYLVPQLPIRCRLAEERDRHLSHAAERKKHLAEQDLSVKVLDHIEKLERFESQVKSLGLGIYPHHALTVKFSAVVSGLMPFLVTAVQELLHRLS